MERTLSAGEELINELLLENHISLQAVYKFAENNLEEIEKAQSIFKRKSEKDIKRCLSVFRLLSGKQQLGAVIESFCNRYGIDDTSVEDAIFEEHKLFLLAAFIYNPTFFAMSSNVCGIIMSELAYKAKEKEKAPQVENIKWFTAVLAGGKPDWYNVAALAASSADEALREIWSRDIEEEDIRGTLRILANNKDNAGEVQFRYRFKDYPGPMPPYFLRVAYKTNSDGIKHTADLTISENSKRKKELVIFSAPQKGINYSGGIAITKLEKKNNV